MSYGLGTEENNSGNNARRWRHKEVSSLRKVSDIDLEERGPNENQGAEEQLRRNVDQDIDPREEVKVATVPMGRRTGDVRGNNLETREKRSSRETRLDTRDMIAIVTHVWKITASIEIVDAKGRGNIGKDENKDIEKNYMNTRQDINNNTNICLTELRLQRMRQIKIICQQRLTYSSSIVKQL